MKSPCDKSNKCSSAANSLLGVEDCKNIDKCEKPILKFEDTWANVTEPDEWDFKDISDAFIKMLRSNHSNIKDGIGGTKIDTWMIKQLAEAFDKHKKDKRTNFESLLRFKGERKNELGRNDFIDWVHRLRFLFGLNQPEAVKITFQVAMHLKETEGYFPDIDVKESTLLYEYKHCCKESYEEWIQSSAPTKETKHQAAIACLEAVEIWIGKSQKLRNKLKNKYKQQDSQTASEKEVSP